MLKYFMLTLIACTVAITTSTVTAQDQHGFKQRIYKDEQGEHRYALFVPKNYTPNRKWPVIMNLHGAGERGRDGFLQTTSGLGPSVRRRAETFPFLVVFPQVEDKRGRIFSAWSADSPAGKRALAILKEVEQDYQVDPQRRILTGWSMGGYGAWSLAAAKPEMWSALVPVSGGGDPNAAERLKSLPIWAFHGANDVVVNPSRSEQMIAALKQAGADPHYTLFSDTGHDVWKKVYENDALYRWMLNPDSQPDTDPENIEDAVAKSAETYPVVELPFKSAVDISNALYARLGNDMLHALSYSVPGQVPADLLSGRIRDLNDGTTVQGRYFSIAFRRISYHAELSRVHLEAYAEDRLNIQLALKNIRLTIGSTYVSGRRQSASTGPIQIRIGYRSPVWLSIAVRPKIENRKIRFDLVATRFNIPSNNWSVSAPAGISTQGFGMTRERVSSGLVNGLYGSKGRIENEVRAIVPGLLAELEKQMDLAPVSDVVTNFWPLPLYQPRLRIWPEKVTADKNGVSLMFGASIAAIESGTAPKTPQKIVAGAQNIAELTDSPNLQVGLNPNMLKPMTQLLIDNDMARVNVLDLPIEEFYPFADRQQMEKWIPDLARYEADVELWSEIVLDQPVSFSQSKISTPAASDADEPSAGIAGKPQESAENNRQGIAKTHSEGTQVMFHIPDMVLVVSLLDKQTGKRTPYANLRFHMEQNSAIHVERPDYSNRALRMAWEGDPVIALDAQFVESAQPENQQIQSDEIKRVFREGWIAWTQGGPVTQYSVRDVDFGYSKLRLGDIGWSQDYLFAEFSTPTTKITNSFDEALTYETKGPNSGWSEEYQLGPGESHEFEISYPLLYRRQINGRRNVFTLPVGSHSEFRRPVAGGQPQLFSSSAL